MLLQLAAQSAARLARSAGRCSFCTKTSSAEADKIRNFAIIAHVDHGKSSLCSKLFSQLQNGVDGGDGKGSWDKFEVERGITITSKYISFMYQQKYQMNVIDTPGHADFGGEVERVLSMVDGCVLLVDVAEGPMAQTKYVLSKALNMRLRPLVVLNKMDRDAATPHRCDVVHSMIFDLFASLGADDDQLDFPIIYASGKAGWASKEYPSRPGTGMEPLLDAIVEHVPPPPLDPSGMFRMLVTMMEHDPFLGRIATGRVAGGSVALGAPIWLLPREGGPVESGKVTKIQKKNGAGGWSVLGEACGGDIVSVAGLTGAGIGDTISAAENAERLSPGPIDPPTLAMVFSPNSSPLGLAPGNVVTSQKIMERLDMEAANSVSLRVKRLSGGGSSDDKIQVEARGELQLGLLIEGMRRDRFEMEISAPRVLLRREAGELLEPHEEVTCEVPAQCVGDVISALQARKAELVDMHELPHGGRSSLTFEAPTRGLVGFKSTFAMLTQGEGIINRIFTVMEVSVNIMETTSIPPHEYKTHKGPMTQVRKGALVSMADGKVTRHALGELQARGALFVKEGDRVYPGMVIGESSTDTTLRVNPAREKKLSNVRSKQADEKVALTPPRQMTLEDAIGYIQPDEAIEVTPDAMRLRKLDLSDAERKRLLSPEA